MKYTPKYCAGNISMFNYLLYALIEKIIDLFQK